MSGSKPFFTPEQDIEVARRYTGGETPRAIGRSYGVSAPPVVRALKRQGVELRRSRSDYAWKPTPENCAEVVRLRHEGLGVQAIARQVGTGNPVVSRVLREAGIEARYGGQNRRFKGAQVDALVAEHSAGATMSELARRHGCSVVVIGNTLRRAGVEVRRQGHPFTFWTPDRIDWLREQHEAGRSQCDIARELGYTQVRIGQKLREFGIVAATPQARGPAHGSWKGGRTARDGYVFVKLPDDDPMASMRHGSGYVAEHRLVMARKLGRRLLPDETPHHKNLIKDDNSPGNLELWLTSQPSGARVSDLIEWSLGLLDRYMPAVLASDWKSQQRPEAVA